MSTVRVYLLHLSNIQDIVAIKTQNYDPTRHRIISWLFETGTASLSVLLVNEDFKCL